MTRSPARSRRRGTRGRPIALAVLAACLLPLLPGHAQDTTEPSLKAAFIFNIAKFTEWPGGALSPAQTFVACVIGDPGIAKALERMVTGRLVLGHAVTVRRVEPDGALRACHLLYTSRVSAAQAAAITATTSGAPVLTISDTEHFARTMGIAELFVENGRIRFALNPGIARRNHLHLSSQLLVLAARVHDGPGAVR